MRVFKSIMQNLYSRCPVVITPACEAMSPKYRFHPLINKDRGEIIMI